MVVDAIEPEGLIALLEGVLNEIGCGLDQLLRIDRPFLAVDEFIEGGRDQAVNLLIGHREEFVISGPDDDAHEVDDPFILQSMTDCLKGLVLVHSP